GFKESSKPEDCFSHPQEEYKYVTPEKIKDALEALPPTIVGQSPESWSVKESEKTYLPQTKMVRTSLFATPTQKLVESTSHTIE
ncbi:unnamed protein product, partial [Tenebrio molitor]